MKSLSEVEGELLAQIEVLNRSVWRLHITLPQINKWLDSFNPDCLPGSAERTHAIFLLARFLYFGNNEMRELLRALHRDKLRKRIIHEARRALGDTLDSAILETEYASQMERTRFLGLGNPSESGAHMLYLYRQENSLPTHLFVNSHEVIDFSTTPQSLNFSNVKRYILIDDFCGSGEQAPKRAARLVPQLRRCAEASGVQIEIEYHVLIGMKSGLVNVLDSGFFDRVQACLELDESYRAFDAASRYFISPPDHIQKGTAMGMALKYGTKLEPKHPLGWDSNQLVLAFFHNTPDNTLPIFWHSGNSVTSWFPLFRRYPKL